MKTVSLWWSWEGELQKPRVSIFRPCQGLQVVCGNHTMCAQLTTCSIHRISQPHTQTDTHTRALPITCQHQLLWSKERQRSRRWFTQKDIQLSHLRLCKSGRLGVTVQCNCHHGNPSGTHQNQSSQKGQPPPSHFTPLSFRSSSTITCAAQTDISLTCEHAQGHFYGKVTMATDLMHGGKTEQTCRSLVFTRKIPQTYTRRPKREMTLWSLDDHLTVKHLAANMELWAKS